MSIPKEGQHEQPAAVENGEVEAQDTDVEDPHTLERTGAGHAEYEAE